MARTTDSVTFRTELVKSEDSGWHFLLIKAAIATKLGLTGTYKRVICTMNGSAAFQCALMPWGDLFYIIVNKKKREDANIEAGDTVNVTLTRDTSKYGLPMPAEFKEVLRQDKAGDRLFHGLTPGKQRSLLYYIGKIKNIDTRIHRALIVIEHLKKNDGRIVHAELNSELKRPLI